MSNSSAEASELELEGLEILDELRPLVQPEVNAHDAFGAVMCALTQRLTRGEALHLLVNVPLAVRPLFASCTLERDEPAEVFDLPELLRRVASKLNVSVEEADPIARAVLVVVQRRLSPEVFEHVASQLPADIV
jgi:uncharacterized protein (DUF2267 family)